MLRERWYLWLTLAVLIVGGAGTSMTVALRSAQRSIDAEHAARVAAEADTRKQQEASRVVVCALVVAQDNVYREAAPITRAGTLAAAAWHDLRELFKCDGE